MQLGIIGVILIVLIIEVLRTKTEAISFIAKTEDLLEDWNRVDRFALYYMH